MVRAQGSNPAANSKYREPRAPLDVEGYPLAPADLELQQVHVYVRHGERTPVSVRMAEAPGNIPEHWLLCKEARRFRAAVAGSELPDQPSKLDVIRTTERSDGVAVRGECLLGELTDIGRASTYTYGRSLRKIYVEKLGFLPDVLGQSQDVYFRSTNMPRTVESLQQIIHGLYPMSKCESGVIHEVLIRNGREENLVGNTLACRRLETLLVNFAHAAASAYNPTLEPLDRKVSKYIGGNPIRLDGKPRASGVLDTVRAAMAHGIKIPPEFEERAVTSTIEKAVVNEWFSDKTEEVRRLGMGRLLADLSRKMQLKTQEGHNTSAERTPKILIHSTHDTALAGLANTLDVFDDRWPAFTASFTFELFRRNAQLGAETSSPRDALNVDPQVQHPQNSGILQTVLGSSPFRRKLAGEFFVRARYQNRNLMLPFCADEGKHLPGSPELCTLQAFAERVHELTPTDWDAECSVGS
ncbi:phosphoglycerate mutase-like protein [Auriscalpium vulgare]|uniref:Phosphoglycerate mutase-like protein n=1 Tax=Auriscalpium vulgare TaxID=40419 RepID=A0ACB8S483_9AGAM|nr:phosphoglycerate mutase-like protein [Auriscalpium vulgare]